MAFQAPYEITQSQLEHLRLTSVDSREMAGGIYPFFDLTCATRFLVIATPDGEDSGDPGCQWMVDEFPLEIRLRKAIYPRPIVKYRPLVELDPVALRGLYYHDLRQILAGHPDLPEQFSTALAARNVALRKRDRESIRDLFFTLDLRRVTGAASRSGLFSRHRLEPAALKKLLKDTEPAE